MKLAIYFFKSSVLRTICKRYIKSLKLVLPRQIKCCLWRLIMFRQNLSKIAQVVLDRQKGKSKSYFFINACKSKKPPASS